MNKWLTMLSICFSATLHVSVYKNLKVEKGFVLEIADFNT